SIDDHKSALHVALHRAVLLRHARLERIQIHQRPRPRSHRLKRREMQVIKCVVVPCQVDHLPLLGAPRLRRLRRWVCSR
ncbi:hypothetical protein B296_00053514, partial [Ensete ventricosum]